MAVTTKPRQAKKSDGLALTQRIFDGLCHEITTGKLRPGELLSRRRIAQRYGVSYTPVIEAMVRLENVGLVETENAQMARVRRLTIETIHENSALREAYETQAVRLLCERALPEEFEELARRAQEVDAHRQARDASGKDEDPQGVLLHWQFHRRIAELSRCPALVRELERIQLLRQLQAIWLYMPNVIGPARMHSELVEVIATRDPQAADAAMREHVRYGLKKELMGYERNAGSRFGNDRK